MTTQPVSPGLKLAIDLGPLAVFFAINLTVGGPQISRVLIATGGFMAAMAAAMLVSRWKIGNISPMLWISGVMVVLFGGLTLWFHDETFIKVKPTIYYAMFAGLLTFGMLTGRPLLQHVLGSAYPGLTALGWRKLTRNWALFFVAMALLNEYVWRSYSWDFWVGFKLWGAMPLTLLFGIANIPMLMKHGLSDEATAQDAALPPEG